MRRIAPWLLALSLLGTLGGKLDKVEDYERTHYNALSVYMSDLEKKIWLKLKTPEERDAFLKERGHWDRFYKYDADRREQIAAGTVKTGWTEDQVHMAWGQPFLRKRLTGRPAARSELFIYRFEITKDGRMLVWHPKSKATYKAVDKRQLDLYIDDSVVTEITEKPRWE